MTAVLTGATGFVGSRLCAELLRRTDRDLVCFVRAGTEAEATERVRATLRKQDPDVADSPRLRGIPGDVTAGLPDEVPGVTDVYHQ